MTRPTDTLSQVVLLAQVVGLGVFGWYFSSLISAIANFATYSAPGSILELRPSNQPMHELYRSVVSLLVFLVAASSAWLFRLRRANGERTAVLAIAGVTAAASLMAQAPSGTLVAVLSREKAGPVLGIIDPVTGQTFQQGPQIDTDTTGFTQGAAAGFVLSGVSSMA